MSDVNLLVEKRKMATLYRRHLTPAGNQTNVPVTAAATTKSITFARAEQDTSYGVSVLPNWLTTVACTTKTTAGLTLTFGTAAPANATCDVTIYRTE